MSHNLKYNLITYITQSNGTELVHLKRSLNFWNKGDQSMVSISNILIIDNAILHQFADRITQRIPVSFEEDRMVTI